MDKFSIVLLVLVIFAITVGILGMVFGLLAFLREESEHPQTLAHSHARHDLAQAPLIIGRKAE